jgi:hypothetical protein
VVGRSTRSLERMQEPTRKFSINIHFRREALIPAILFGAIVVAAAVMALVAPWILNHFG